MTFTLHIHPFQLQYKYAWTIPDEGRQEALFQQQKLSKIELIVENNL